jgi:hypothetical protein
MIFIPYRQTVIAICTAPRHLYLSGADQEESILLLFPDAPYEHQREMIFLKETNEHIAIWEGEN